MNDDREFFETAERMYEAVKARAKRYEEALHCVVNVYPEGACEAIRQMAREALNEHQDIK